VTLPRPNVAILGGGPGGYEAALVAAQLGADVTVVDEDGLGGACVLTDCVPSKTLIESSSIMTSLGRSASLGLQLASGANPVVEVDAPALNARIKAPPRSRTTSPSTSPPRAYGSSRPEGG
jgi:pyruvate/2-oxoglutarate dehydrogenase complex dihydrolipoamide dehydrogenase (E3) component